MVLHHIWIFAPEIRTLLGWSLKDLAEKMGLSTLSLESMERVPVAFEKHRALMLFSLAVMELSRLKVAVDDLADEELSGTQMILQGRSIFSDALWRSFYGERKFRINKYFVTESDDILDKDAIELFAEVLDHLEQELCAKFMVEELKLEDFAMNYQKMGTPRED